MNYDASYLSCLVDEKYIRNLFEKNIAAAKKLRKEEYTYEVQVG